MLSSSCQLPNFDAFNEIYGPYNAQIILQEMKRSRCDFEWENDNIGDMKNK